MPEFDRKTLTAELKAQLTRRQIVAFAWRMALRVLPQLSRDGHFDAWGEEDRRRHVLARMWVVDVGEWIVLKDLKVANIATKAAYNAAYDGSTPANATTTTIACTATAAIYPYGFTVRSGCGAPLCQPAHYTAASAAICAANTNDTITDQFAQREITWLADSDTNGSLNNLHQSLWHGETPENWSGQCEQFLNALAAVALEDWVEPCRQRFLGVMEDPADLERRASIPKDIFDQGADAAIAWLHAQRSGSRPLREAKLLLVGEGGSGKTSLWKRLLYNTSAELNEPSTHGINRKEWLVDGIRTHIWDFGGQDIQLSAHRLFLTERSLYILVLDRRKEEEPEHWLEHIRSLGGKSPVLVVWNKIDEHPTQTVSEKYLKDRYPNIVGFFPLSCRSGQGFNEFTPRLKKAIGALELVNKPFPNTWHQVKTRLEEESAAGKHWLSYDTFQLLCEEAGETNRTAQRELIKHLNNLGTICFFDDPELAHLQILNPQWLLTGVYKLLTSHITAQRFGSIFIDDFPDILAAVEADDFHYDRVHYPYLIALMKKFELCQAYGKQILIPAAFAPEPKGEYEEFRQRATAHYFIQYQHRPPTSIIHRFIARLLPDAEDNDYWSTGIRLRDDTLQARALVQLNRQERCIDFWIIAEDPLPYWLRLRDHIREINSFFAVIEWRERFMVGQKMDESLDFNDLLAAKSANVSKYFAPSLRKEISVDESLEELATSEEIDRRIKAQLFDVLKGVQFRQETHIHNSPVTDVDVHTHVEAKATSNATLTIEQSEKFEELSGAVNYALRAVAQDVATEQTKLLQEVLKVIEAIHKAPDKRTLRTSGFLHTFEKLADSFHKMERWSALGDHVMERLQMVKEKLQPVIDQLTSL